MLGADAVAGIFASLKFLDRRLFDLTNYGAQGNIAAQHDAGFGDCLDRDHQSGETAFHVAGAEAPDPTVTVDAFGSKAFARKMLFVAAIGRIHVAGEQKIQSVAAASQMRNRIGTVVLDELP